MRLFFIFVCLVFFTGCHRICGTFPEVRAASPSGKFQAGAAKNDITPMPGFPMGGFSLAGKVSRGYWTRLYARAIYLEDEGGMGWHWFHVTCGLSPEGLQIV